MPATVPSGVADEIRLFREHARAIRDVFRMNTEGLTHDESVARPRPAGNCANWVVGHLVSTYNGMLPLLGQLPVLDDTARARYARGAAPLTDAAEALALNDLLAAWEASAERFETGLASLTPDLLDRPAPSSPAGDPDETIRSLLCKILFHQAYHIGQIGLLRRLNGQRGAIP